MKELAVGKELEGPEEGCGNRDDVEMIEVGMRDLERCYGVKDFFQLRSLALGLLFLILRGLCRCSSSWAIAYKVLSDGRDAIEKEDLTQNNISAVEAR